MLINEQFCNFALRSLLNSIFKTTYFGHGNADKWTIVIIPYFILFLQTIGHDVRARGEPTANQCLSSPNRGSVSAALHGRPPPPPPPCPPPTRSPPFPSASSPRSSSSARRTSSSRHISPSRETSPSSLTTRQSSWRWTKNSCQMTLTFVAVLLGVRKNFRCCRNSMYRLRHRHHRQSRIIIAWSRRSLWVLWYRGSHLITNGMMVIIQCWRIVGRIISVWIKWTVLLIPDRHLPRPQASTTTTTTTTGRSN